VVRAALHGDPWKVAGASICGSMPVLLCAFPVRHHSLRGRARTALQKLDHQSICRLVAGSNTPFCLVPLRGVWG
jgi:hemolysin III